MAASRLLRPLSVTYTYAAPKTPEELARMLEREKLGDILVNLQVLTPAEVERVLYAMRRRGGQAKFGQVAKEMGLVREEHILAALAVQMQLFPGIQDLSLNRLLSRLQEPPVPANPATVSRGRRVPRLSLG